VGNTFARVGVHDLLKFRRSKTPVGLLGGISDRQTTPVSLDRFRFPKTSRPAWRNWNALRQRQIRSVNRGELGYDKSSKAGQKLEQSESLSRHLPPMEQLKRALDEAAVRLTGKSFSFVQGDEPAIVWVISEVRDSFMQKLSPADRNSLIAELETIAFGDDTAALEALRQKVMREVDEEFGVMAS
jgi:hypothetical protein